MATHIVKGNRADNVFEAVIPIKALGITTIPENTTIAISNPSIWRGSVAINYAGAPTGPWILVGIGLLFAVTGLFWQQRHAKNRQAIDRVMQHA